LLCHRFYVLNLTSIRTIRERVLTNLRMLLMPIRRLLKSPSRHQYRRVISRAPYKLQPHRQILIRETAWHRKCRQPAKVTDPAQRIGKRKPRN